MYLLKILILLLFVGNAYGSLSFPENPPALGLNSIELRKNQRLEYEKNAADFKRRADEAQKRNTHILSKIALDVLEVQNKLKGASEREADYLNKKLALLNDRKQKLLDFQDLWKETSDDLAWHIKLLGEIISFLQAPKPDIKPAYSWKDFREAQMRLTEYLTKIQSDKNKRDNLHKQRSAASERLISLEKQLLVKDRERIKLLSSADGDKNAQYDSTVLKTNTDILDQEISALNESSDYVKLLIEKLQIDSKLWDDILDFEQRKLDDQKMMLGEIENRLILDYNDVDIAKSAWKTEVQSALTLREELNQLRDTKKLDKEKYTIELEFLRDKVTKMKAKGVVDQASYQLAKAHLKYIQSLVYAFDKELLLIDASKDLADTQATEKELQYNMVELSYKLKTDIEDLEEQLVAFYNKKDLATSALNSFKDRRTNAITSLIETNRALDKIKVTQDKIALKRASIFKGREYQLQEVMVYLEKTKEQLTRQLHYTQAYLAVNADLIIHQEKIVDHYNLILNKLEARQKSYSIWKRSVRAISVDALVRSALEAELFFKKLYWETPANVRPSVLINFIKSLRLYDYFLLMGMMIFYVLAFLALRMVLIFARKKSASIVERYQGRNRYQYIHLGIAILDFMLDYFALLFTLFFVFLHIIFKFRYIFQGLRLFASAYWLAIFFLITIPILVYLSGKFIMRLKELNTRLSYLFFAEKFQNRFILLVTVFCYATAILLPLRLALIYYTDMQYSEFATVILAAYSLVLIVVLAFLFSKEDVLKFIPASTSFLILVKRKIDKHFYPVFFFILGLFILCDPFVGYSNMAWFLAFAVPTSIFLAYLLFSMHLYIRRYAVFLFMKEDDDEITDKFEHAKAYYGFFVIFSFILLLFVTFMLVARIWGFNYTPVDVWRALSDQWVVRIGVDNKIGFVEFMIIGLFIAAGFFASSLIHKFILNRLFDILRSEPGTQNTISRIVHYTTIFLSVVLGLNAVHLGQFIFWVGAPFVFALGLASKDIVSDLFAGFFVLIERPIEIGNYVQIDNIQGTVHKIAPRATTIITSRNHSVIIPNKDLVSKWIVNWGHGRFAVGFELNVRVEQYVDPEVVRRTLFGVVQANPLILKVPAVVARLEDIEENALNFLVRAFISARRVKEQWEIAAALRTEILKAFRENKIALAQPIQLIQFDGEKNGARPTSIDIRFDKQ